MQLPDKAIKELQDILKKDYGQILSKEDTQELGGRLLRLARAARAALLRREKGIKH